MNLKYCEREHIYVELQKDDLKITKLSKTIINWTSSFMGKFNI